MPAEPQTKNSFILSLRWWPKSLPLAMATGLIASLLPPRLRLLGVFALIEGTVVGALLSRFMPLSCTSKTNAVVRGVLPGVLAFVVTSLCWWQVYRTDLKSRPIKPNPASAMAARLLAEAPQSGAVAPLDAAANDPDAPEPSSDSEAIRAEQQFRDSLQQALAEEKTQRERQLRFVGWIVHHTAALKLGQSPAVIVWSIEVILCGLSSAWFLARQNKTAEPNQGGLRNETHQLETSTP